MGLMDEIRKLTKPYSEDELYYEFDDEDLWIELEADDICELPTDGLF